MFLILFCVGKQSRRAVDLNVYYCWPWLKSTSPGPSQLANVLWRLSNLAISFSAYFPLHVMEVKWKTIYQNIMSSSCSQTKFIYALVFISIFMVDPREWRRVGQTSLLTIKSEKFCASSCQFVLNWDRKTSQMTTMKLKLHKSSPNTLEVEG